jgi:hypothetical protein
MKNFKIISHRRSGTHFLWNTLSANFTLPKDPSPEGAMGGFKWHRPFKYTPSPFTTNYNCIYLVRDPRDTLVSSWHYFKKGGESTSLKMRQFLANKSFSAYIRGCTVDEMHQYVKFKEDSIDAGLYLNPVKHWVDYAEWSNHVYTIRFEDLKADPTKVLEDFAEAFEVPPNKLPYVTIKKLVGHFPRKGVAGDWQSLFSEEDNRYVIEVAEDFMKKFNYI